MRGFFNRRRVLHGGVASLLGVGGASAAALAQFAPSAGGSGSVDHEPFARLLARYVRSYPDGVNRVDYAGWKAAAADIGALDAYLQHLQALRPAVLSRAEQFAYWANLYNGETLRVVLGAYPVKSILLVHPILLAIGPWKAKTLNVAGTKLSLDEVENAILRPLFGDPRVHYALNCASASCPNLRPAPWRGAGLDAELDAAAAAYVNHPRAVKLTDRGLRLSSIYQWYRRDFGDSDAGILSHLRRYARPELRAELDAGPRISGYGYDWGLNDRAR